MPGAAAGMNPLANQFATAQVNMGAMNPFMGGMMPA